MLQSNNYQQSINQSNQPQLSVHAGIPLESIQQSNISKNSINPSKMNQSNIPQGSIHSTKMNNQSNIPQGSIHLTKIKESNQNNNPLTLTVAGSNMFPSNNYQQSMNQSNQPHLSVHAGIPLESMQQSNISKNSINPSKMNQSNIPQGSIHSTKMNQSNVPQGSIHSTKMNNQSNVPQGSIHSTKINQSNAPQGSTNSSNLQINIYQKSVNSNAHQSKYPSNVQQSNKYQQTGVLPSYHDSQFNNGQSIYSTNMKQSNKQSAKGSNFPHGTVHPSQINEINPDFESKLLQSHMNQQKIKDSKAPESYIYSSDVYKQSMKQSNASNFPNNNSSRQSAKQSIQSHK
jgi:hypothetical protein